METSFRKLLKEILVRVNRMTLPSPLLNFEYNRRTWNRYARFRNKFCVYFEDPSVSEKSRRTSRELGVEWGKIKDVEEIIAEYIYPYVTEESVVGEIGSGGGRIASRVAGRVKEFYCFDISSQMLKRVKAVLGDNSNVSYVLLDSPALPPRFTGTFDFLYSFDVFVHLDLHLMWKYFREMHSALKKHGRAFIHTANLVTPNGWKRFSGQDCYSVEGYYFVSPEIIGILADRSGLRIVKTSSPDPANFYLNRDYLVVLEKPQGSRVPKQSWAG